jgi:hypothetical protein
MIGFSDVFILGLSMVINGTFMISPHISWIYSSQNCFMWLFPFHFRWSTTRSRSMRKCCGSLIVLVSAHQFPSVFLALKSLCSDLLSFIIFSKYSWLIFFYYALYVIKESVKLVDLLGVFRYLWQDSAKSLPVTNILEWLGLREWDKPVNAPFLGIFADRRTLETEVK